MKTLFAALVLTLAPGLALAACFGHEAKSESAMTCAPGTLYDDDSKTCVPTTG